jgi:hypothetical protein
VEKIWYSAIQQNAFSLLFGEEVELLQTGIKNIQNDLHNEVIPA